MSSHSSTLLPIATAASRLLPSSHLSAVSYAFALWLPGTSYATIFLFSLLNGAVFGVVWVVSQLPDGGFARIFNLGLLAGLHSVEVADHVELPPLLYLSWVTITLPTPCKNSRVYQSHPFLPFSISTSLNLFSFP